MATERNETETEEDATEERQQEDAPDRDGDHGLPSPDELLEKAKKPRDKPEMPAREGLAVKIPNYPASVPKPPSDLDPYRPEVDKYFGTKLPPVCRKLGCYVTDNGKFFYCVNPNCHKDRKRETKYNRRRKSFIYFFCPKCRSREIQLHLRKNQYECMDCAYNWRK